MKQRYAHCLLVLLALMTAVRVGAQEIIRFEGKYMLLNYRNEVITPGFDSIVAFDEYDERHFGFRSQGKWAMVKKIDLPGTDWTSLQPKYDFIRLSQSPNSNIAYIVGISGKVGALNRSLKETVAVAYDDIFVASSYSVLTAIRKGDKLALILPKEQAVFADQSFGFIYDELLSGPGFQGGMSFRKGTKYGFCYRHEYEMYMTEAVYDAPVKRSNIFLKAQQNGRNIYFYSYEFSYSTDTAFFSLEAGEESTFIHLGTFDSLTIDGPKRSEKCYYNYPYLLVGIDHKDEILVYDFEQHRKLNVFPSGGATYSFERLNMMKSYYSRDYTPVCYVKTRIHSTEGETLMTESYTELQGMNKVVEQDLPFEYTLVLEKYALNGDYLCVRQQDQYGQLNHFKRYFAWDSEQRTYTAVKPEKDRAHRRSSWGGGNADGWRGLLWMGGR